jgi:Na+-translocating ferredoxin:NAD+ oxidoreductase subunit B
MNLTLIAVFSLGGVGLVLAIILFWAARKFKVYEDPRIDDIEAALPGANCGACGFPGCRNFAETCVSTSNFEALLCPVGGQLTMNKVASILGKETSAVDVKVAVLRCNGACEHRPRTSIYNGVSSCAVASLTYGGETDCSWGCLGLADCVRVCTFDALSINPETGLPEVDEKKCTSCGACVKACPKDLFQLRKKGPESRRIFVACRNKDKGAVAMKACKVSCIGCGKCEKVCAFGAIDITNDLAYIDFNTCTLCRECVDVCPTKAIQAINVPVRSSNIENS